VRIEGDVDFEGGVLDLGQNQYGLLVVDGNITLGPNAVWQVDVATSMHDKIQAKKLSFVASAFSKPKVTVTLEDDGMYIPPEGWMIATSMIPISGFDDIDWTFPAGIDADMDPLGERIIVK
jgi:hypothetical protein